MRNIVSQNMKFVCKCEKTKYRTISILCRLSVNGSDPFWSFRGNLVAPLIGATRLIYCIFYYYYIISNNSWVVSCSFSFFLKAPYVPQIMQPSNKILKKSITILLYFKVMGVKSKFRNQLFNFKNYCSDCWIFRLYLKLKY